MASSFEHKETGRFLTRFDKTSKVGDVHTLSIYSKAKDGRWCEFTQYTLSEPEAFDRDGAPLFDLQKCSPVCAIDARR
jgi:hypothetical protein